ncbi:hypothetical protein GOP47_0009173 [Adiantum capillus-veneris]|uniref:Uncharacterized protein n=1 Tax=Adiantum capillus-veneris TaxID=13818 RepID=A0A9D4ZIF7_ADICA|nr:hypothetical protein GOP47_0009173 [Adiantum capillus-veneris]
MGISQDSTHKRRATGGKKKTWHKKRKYELGQQPSMTKLSSNKTVDAAPFRQWYSQHYGVDLGKKKRATSAKKETEDTDATAGDGEKKQSKYVERKISARNEDRKLDAHLEDQIASGRLLACISSRLANVGEPVIIFLK